MRVFYFLYNILIARKIIISNRNRINSIEKTSAILKFFKLLKLFNWWPKKAKTNTRGVNPINEDMINFILDIFNKDSIKFWNIRGGPGIILKIIRYSIEDLEIYWSTLVEYLLIKVGNIFFKKKDENNENNKLPKTKVIIDII